GFVDVHLSGGVGAHRFHEVEGARIIVGLIGVERNSMLGAPEQHNVPGTVVRYTGNNTPDSMLRIFFPFGRPQKGIFSRRRTGEADDFGFKSRMHGLQRLIGLTENPTASITCYGEEMHSGFPLYAGSISGERGIVSVERRGHPLHGGNA